MTTLYRFEPGIFTSEIRQKINDTVDSQWLKELQQECAQNRNRYKITYDERRESFFCGEEMDAEDREVPFAIYSGVLSLCTDNTQKAQLRAGNRVAYNKGNPDIADFDMHTIDLTTEPDGDGEILLKGHIEDDSIHTFGPKVERAEYASHSCAGGNCILRSYTTSGARIPVLVLYARGTIPQDSPLTYYYGCDYPMPIARCEQIVEKLKTKGQDAYVKPCRCSAQSCGNGFICPGLKPLVKGSNKRNRPNWDTYVNPPNLRPRHSVSEKKDFELMPGVYALENIPPVNEEQCELFIRFASLVNKEILGKSTWHGLEIDRKKVEMRKRWEIPMGILHAMLHGSGRSHKAFNGILKNDLDTCKQVDKVVTDLLPYVIRSAHIASGMDKKYVHVTLGVVEPGAMAQLWHADGIEEDRFTFSIAAVPVTNYPDQGQTEFGENESSFKTFPGPKLWKGDVMHRGGANTGGRRRLTLFFMFDNKPRDVLINFNVPFKTDQYVGGLFIGPVASSASND